MNARKAYRFGDFELKITARVLTRNGKQIPLGSKAFDVLTSLVMRAGEVVSKDELLQAAWPDAFVEEGNLTQQISALRKALGEYAGYIVTIAGKGYQFAAEVKIECPVEIEQKPAGELAAKAERPSLFVVESRPRTAVQPVEEEEEENAPSPRTGDVNAEGFHQVHEIAPAPSAGDVEDPRRTWRGKLLWWSVGTAFIILGMVIGYLVASTRRVPFEHFTIQKATESGNVHITAISPDGVYLASVLRDADGNESLWVHHISTGSERPILQDPRFHYEDVTFSPDGSFVYIRIQAVEDKPLDASRSDLYRIPILGGKAARIAEGVDAQITFVEKGQRLCFYRETKPKIYAFISAAADGGDERVLLTGKAPYPIEAACAPDGKRAVVEDAAGNLEIRNFDSRSTGRLLSSDQYDGWFKSPVWQSGGKGIFGILSGNSPIIRQLAFLSYPGGVLRQITNDLSEYHYVSVTTKADAIAASQMERSASFIEVPLAKPAGIQEHAVEGLHWFSWIDGHTIITSDVNGVLRTVDLTDGKTIMLNLPKERGFFQPSPCGPRAMVTSGGDRSNGRRSIYRMNLDGSGATLVTHGPDDLLPKCTLDEKWLFYNDNRDDKNSVVMRMSLSGGAMQKVTDGQWSSVSPDGKLIAVVGEESRRLNVFSTESLRELDSFPMPAGVAGWTAFSADSKSIFYASEPRIASQTRKAAIIWRQAREGGAPVKVASFPGRYVFWIDASPDGAKLGATVMAAKYNAVLLHEVR